MNVSKFLSQVSEQGIARTNNWMCFVYPPSVLYNRVSYQNLTQTPTPVGQIASNEDIKETLKYQERVQGNFEEYQRSKNESFNYTGKIQTVDSLSMYCTVSSIPGRDLDNFEWKEYGEKTTYASNHTHSGLVINYYLSEDLRERTIFEIWQNLIFDPITKQHGYYDDTVSIIDIVKYNSNWKEQLTYRLHDAYPTNISAIELGEEGNIAQISVTFNYKNFTKL
jgi:hypothetical protein